MVTLFNHWETLFNRVFLGVIRMMVVVESDGVQRGIRARSEFEKSKKINLNCDKDVAKVRESVLLDRGA